MSTPQGAHLVGSINLETAEETFRLASEQLGTHLKRIPDGEVGERFHWIAFQAQRLAQTEGIDHIGDEPKIVRGVDFRPVQLNSGVRADELQLRPLGYAEAALASYEVFSRLVGEGVIDEITRFQVSLPTPLGVVGSFVVTPDRADFEPVYEAALAREIDAILEAIPANKLSFQWDAALEFAHIEGAGYGAPSETWYEEDAWEATTTRLARQIDRIPAEAEVGVHLCYGDVGEKHFIEPEDAANLVRFANGTQQKAHRRLTWVHLPVPIERDDHAYFAPLAGLQLAAETELYLGLVHREDGVEGAQRRATAAGEALERPWGVSTECGFGRAPEGTTTDLFATHQAVARSW